MNMSVDTAQKIQFIYIANPLQPAETRLSVPYNYDREKSLADYLGDLEGEWAVSVSGRVVEKTEWALTYPAPTDCVVAAPMIHGGGGGGSKNILRMVALIALTVVAGPAGLAAAGALGGGAVMAAGISAGIMIAGTMAINALLPPPKPKLPSTGDNFSSSPTYGIDGPKNLSTRGIPVPVIYGEAWFAGNFINSYVENVGEDQYLHLMMNVGEGPIESISDILINDQPLANFSNVEVWTRNGSENQEVIPYFGDVIVPENRSAALKNGVWTVHTVNEPVDRLRVDIVMPQGISLLDEEDGLGPFTAQFALEIREQGGIWAPFTGGASSTITISGKQMSALRRSYYSNTLNRSKLYEVRATHLQDDEQESVSNKITLTDVNLITFDDFNYKHTALLALRIKLDDQLNGVPSVKYKVKGRKVPVYDALTGNYVDTWTDNPAWIALDALMNKRYGGQLPVTRFKMDYFRQWATFCTANNLKFNGAIDQRTNLWDAIVPIAKVGRAQIVRAGTRFQVAIVRQQAPSQLFSVGNIKKGSLSIEWLPSDERANEVHVSYFDKTDGGKQKTVIVPNIAARERGEEAKPTELTLYGVDNVEQATKEGQLAMNMQSLLQTISFDVPVESIACTLGDVVAVQHDMPQWGEGGLTEAGSTKNLLKLDKPVEMEVGGTYVVKVRHDQVVQATFEVDTIVGNVVFPSFGFNVMNYERYRRLFCTDNGGDYAIEEPIIDQFGRHGLRLDRTTGLTVGATIQLIDTNVIETRTVAAFTGSVTELVPTVPFSTIPRPETPWSFGLSESVVQMLTVMNISGGDDLWKTISGLEYKDEAYGDEVVDIKPAPINTAPSIADVTFNGFQELRRLEGAVYVSDVEFSWSHASTGYAYAEVHVSVDGEPWRYLGDNASIYTVRLNAGELRVKIVPVTLEGFKRAFGMVAIHTFNVQAGAPSNPPEVLDVRAEARKNLIEIKWGNIDSWAANKNIYRYEVWGAPGQNANINDATLLGTTGNDHYPHVGLQSDAWWTYWVRAVNILANNKKSGFAPVAGLSIKTLPADTVSELFPGGISLTDLEDSLREDIEHLPELVEVNISGDINEMSRLVSELHAKVEAVTDSNKTEIFKRKEAIGNVEALVEQEVFTLVQADEALAGMITNIQAQIGEDIQAQIEEEKVVRAAADAAEASARLALKTQIAGDIAAAVNTESIARSAADGSLAGQITQLTTKMGTDIAAAVNTEAIARSTADTALAGQITSLTTKMGTDIAAAVQVEATARATADSAISSTVTTLTSRVGTAESAITTEQQTRASADSALSGRIDSLTARTTTAEAAITTEQQARANGDSANATSITNLTTRVGSAETSISQQATSINGLHAQYTVKINNNGHISGFGLASTANNVTGGALSEFVVVADRFRVVKPGTASPVPVFVVDAATGRVVIANAIVGDLQSDNYVAGVSGWCIKK